MDDLISRKSLLNKINAYVVGSQDKEFICKLIKEMSSVENKGEWIPVSERLPEKTGFYLCTVGATWKNPRVMKYEPKECVNDAYLWQGDDDSYVYNWFVEAWRPLPAPYKAEKGSEEK